MAFKLQYRHWLGCVSNRNCNYDLGRGSYISSLWLSIPVQRHTYDLPWGRKASSQAVCFITCTHLTMVYRLTLSTDSCWIKCCSFYRPLCPFFISLFPPLSFYLSPLQLVLCQPVVMCSSWGVSLTSLPLFPGALPVCSLLQTPKAFSARRISLSSEYILPSGQQYLPATSIT